MVLDRQPVGVTGQATPCGPNSPSASVPLLTAPVVVRVNTVACAGPAAPIAAIAPASRTVLHVTVTFLLLLPAHAPVAGSYLIGVRGRYSSDWYYIDVYNGGLFLRRRERRNIAAVDICQAAFIVERMPKLGEP